MLRQEAQELLENGLVELANGQDLVKTAQVHVNSYCEFIYLSIHLCQFT